MELREALTQIAEIRLQLARTQIYRGFRALPVALTGAVALATAGLQEALLPEPSLHLPAYLALWIGAAVASASAAGAGMVLRQRHAGPGSTREVTWAALGQLAPCLAAGALLTDVIVRSASESAWMLPGLWQVLFSLGIFASCPHLPRPTAAVGAFYLATGIACLSAAKGEAAFSPWAMGVPFGVGQLLASAILYWTLERGDVQT